MSRLFFDSEIKNVLLSGIFSSKNSLAGSMPIEDDGSTYIWESTFFSKVDDTGADLWAVNEKGVMWKKSLL